MTKLRFVPAIAVTSVLVIWMEFKAKWPTRIALSGQQRVLCRW